MLRCVLRVMVFSFVLSGTMWNLKSCLSSTHQAEALSAVVKTLAHCLSLDAGALNTDLCQKESSRLASSGTADPESAGMEEQRTGASVQEEEEMDEGEINMNRGKRNGKKMEKEFAAFQPVRKLRSHQ